MHTQRLEAISGAAGAEDKRCEVSVEVYRPRVGVGFDVGEGKGGEEGDGESVIEEGCFAGDEKIGDW